MNAEVRNYIKALLGTIHEGIECLKVEENPQLKEDIWAARSCVEMILEENMSISLGGRVNSGVLSDEEWIHTVMMVLDDIERPLELRNAYDRKFQALLNYVWKLSEEQLVEGMKQSLVELKTKSEMDYEEFVLYFEYFPLWGELHPEQGNYETLELRAATLKRRSYDFLWLYKRLGDYLSKRTLCAILLNWAILDREELKAVKSIFPDYFEPDIFPSNEGDVFVDVGAFVGDSVLSYISTYGDSYKHIYAYEISKDSCEHFRENTKDCHSVEIRRKGVGSERGIMYITENEYYSANKLMDNNGEECIEIVALDEDIDEKITFIKMDIEGAEQSALAGCRKIIENNRPKLAICTYHGYEDIWKIPLLIYEMNPEYTFYMRHNGRSLIPTEFVLLCR